jgi:putative radical SAM enzyme (TIGR03279 family)
VSVGLLEVVPVRQGPARPGGEIARVVSGSPAAEAGLRAGDRLVAINGLVVRDAIDYAFETLEPRLDLAIERNGQLDSVRVEKLPDQELGLEFALPVFEGIRECNNNCEFCFIRGLPKGLRRSLYIRDDDYRYSFLFGTFLTLTNLEESDWERIGFQHLSPLHVSIHATDLAVRRRMLANPATPDILVQLDRLAGLGIEVKGQVVLCPGLNDGAVLERTVRDLAERPGVVDSVAIVPVGLTRYSGARTLRQVSPAEARRLVRQARGWQRELRARLGRDFVYLSDELYLLAGQPFPPAWRYDGYRQLQNGVGLTRLLLADWSRSRSKIPAVLASPRRVAWVCGRAAAPALRRICADLRAVASLQVTVIEVSNEFFGGGVSVSGLLTGQDVVAGLQARSLDLAILPRSAFGYEGQQMLDGWTVAAIERAAGVRVATGGGAAELLELTLAG